MEILLSGLKEVALMKTGWIDWLDLKTMDSLNATMTEQNLNNYDTLLNSDHLDLPY